MTFTDSLRSGGKIFKVFELFFRIASSSITRLWGMNRMLCTQIADAVIWTGKRGKMGKCEERDRGSGGWGQKGGGKEEETGDRGRERAEIKSGRGK